jgi:hypothetical protein
MGIKITYGVSVCNEFLEIQRLLNFLLQNKRLQDNIVVLFDEANGDPEVETFLRTHSINGEFAWHKDKFNKHFSDWKNKISSLCSGDYIVNIDADEIPNSNLLSYLPEILEENPEIDVFKVPRINTVDGIGLSHVKYKWGWNISKLESIIGEKELDLNNPQDLDEYNLLKEYNLIIKETPHE